MTKYNAQLHKDLRAMDEKAIPAPWSYHIVTVDSQTGEQYDQIRNEDAREVALNPGDIFRSDDLDVLIAARNALPLLLDEIEKRRDTGDWHDLTSAIKAGEPIDWEKLDGRRAKCEHESGIEVYHKLERDNTFPANSSLGHFAINPRSWRSALVDSWQGSDGWTLYIDGPIPLKRKTADQLDPATYFVGLTLEGEEAHFITVRDQFEELLAVPVASPVGTRMAEKVEVLEVRGNGTFEVVEEEK